jgi:hypothetical protein
MARVWPITPPAKRAGYHADGKIDAEDLRPESGGLIVVVVIRTDGQRLEHHDQWRQSHGQLWK